MPRWLSSAPRKKLPPPTTMAISTCPTAAAISRAIWLTASGFTPSWPAPNASPDNFRRTRRRPVASSITWDPLVAFADYRTQAKGPHRLCDAGLPEVLRADLEAGEAGEREPSVLGHLRDGQLVVLRVVLVEQRDLLEERVHATLDDLRKGCLRLALLTRDLGDDLALLVDV